MNRTAVYTGTFDPLTLGHLDILRRAARLCDRLVVGVATAAAKMPLLPIDQRLAIVATEAERLGLAIEVRPFDGLAVDFAVAEGAQLIVRGLRGGADFEYERPMAAMNGSMAPGVETVFLLASPATAHIASSLVKDVARGGGPLELFVSADVAHAIRAAITA